MDGDMIRFEYHGKTAYVAEYCCKLLKQEPAKKTEPAQREAVIEVKKSESDRASNTIQAPPQAVRKHNILSISQWTEPLS